LEYSLSLEKEYLERAEEIYEQDRTKLLANWGVTLDDQGRISNRTEIEEGLIKANNEEGLADFKKIADSYTESLNTVEEKQISVIDKQNEIFSEKLAEINRKLEYAVRVEDAHLTLLEHQLSTIEDDAFEAAEAIAKLGEVSEANLRKFEAH
jgi:hypothetical protein